MADTQPNGSPPSGACTSNCKSYPKFGISKSTIAIIISVVGVVVILGLTMGLNAASMKRTKASVEAGNPRRFKMGISW